MKKFLPMLVASFFAASVCLPAHGAEPASAPAAEKAAADNAKTNKPRRHWCKTTQQFQTEPCPKKPRRHWCKATQQFQTEPCPKKPRRHWCITTQQFQTEPCPKKVNKAPEVKKESEPKGEMK